MPSEPATIAPPAGTGTGTSEAGGQWDAPTWHLEEVGNPVPGVIGQLVGAVAVAPGLVPQDPYVFTIIEGRLYVAQRDVDKWRWTVLGNPPGGVTITKPNGAVAGQQSTWEAQRPFAFVRGSDGHLWVNSRSGTGDVYAESGGVVSVRASGAVAPEPYVFVIDAHGAPLKVNSPTWSWTSLPGTDPASIGNFNSGATVSAERDLATGAQVPYAFYWSQRTQRLMVDWLG